MRNRAACSPGARRPRDRFPRAARRPLTALLGLLAIGAAAPGSAQSVHEDAHPPDSAEHVEETHHGPSGGIALFAEEGGILPFGAMLVNFVVLLSAILLFGRKPMSTFLRARHDAIQDGLDEARALRQRAEAKYAEYSDRLAAFQEEIDRLVGEFRRAGEAERDRIVSEAKERTVRIRREAEFLVSQEIKQVRIDLHREAVERAIEAAEKRLEGAVTPNDQERLAQEYVSTLARTAEGRARA